MRRFSNLFAIGPLIFMVILASLPLQAKAQQPPAIRHTISLGFWFSSATASETAGSSTWSSTIWNLDYRGRSLTAPWGIHLHYATGSRETFWAADVAYIPSFRLEDFSLSVFAGYGSFRTSTSFTSNVTSAGFRVGVNASRLFQLAAGPSLSFDLRVAWHPSNTVTTPAGTTSGSATEFMVATTFKFPWRTSMTPEPAGYYLTNFQRDGFDPNWSGRVGYKSLSFTGSSFQWTGPFFEIFKTF